MVVEYVEEARMLHGRKNEMTNYFQWTEFLDVIVIRQFAAIAATC